MGPLVAATDLSKALIDAGNNLLKPHSSTDEILTLLDKIETLLATVEQDPTASVQAALIPSTRALVSADLLRNPDSDVRVFVVSCLTEIMRITAPEAPYDDDKMKVTIEAFGKLADASCRSYKKAEVVLETVSKVRSSLVMLDLECDDLVLEMFRQFLKIISPDHPQLVLLSMETVMITVIDESEDVSMDLLDILLTAVKKESLDVSPTASRLVERVLSSCAPKLQPYIMEALKFKGTSLDMYSPVVSSICQSESATTQAHSVINTKENEAVEKLSEKQGAPSGLLEDKLELGLSRKGNRSKRTARGGTRRANEDEARTENSLKQPLKQVKSESTDAETESGSSRKRGRKPNSLMNPDEGYTFKTSSSKKMQEKELGDSSLEKLAANKASLSAKSGQTNQSVVISLSSSSKARTGSRKRSRTKMEETNNDVTSIATQTSKKKIEKKDKSEEENIMEANLDKPDDVIKNARSSKKEKAQNGSAKTSAKKPLAETKVVKTSGKKLAHSDAKKKNSEGASMDTPISSSSKLKKKNSGGITSSAKKSEQNPKNHNKRKRTAREDVESNTNELGLEMVGKKVNVWWPLDKQFYEGVIVSYCSRKKEHRVSYYDGDAEELNLANERFEIIQDHSSAIEDKEIDLPETIPLSELIQMQKIKKRKNVSMKVGPSSSPEVRSLIQTTKKKSDSTKQSKRTKGAVKAVSNEPESNDEKIAKSLNEVNGEPGRTKSRSGKKQKVNRGKHFKSEKECVEKETPKTQGGDGVEHGKSDVEPDAMGEHQELPQNQNAETKTDGEDQKSTKEPSAACEADVKERNSLEESDAEPRTGGECLDAAKEPTAEPKTDEEEQKIAEETNAEPETDVKEHKSLKETNVEPKTEGEEGKSAKEPAAEPETKLDDKEPAEVQTAETKLTENEDTCEAKGQEIEKETYSSMPGTGKVVENEAEDYETATKELKEESDKAEVNTIPGSVDL